MTQDESLSVVAIACSTILIIGIAVTHGWLYRSTAVALRWRYQVIFSILFMVTLFTPVIDGGDKMGWIPLWTAYQILLMPEFYVESKRHVVIDSLVFGIPVVHHLVCFLVSFIAMKLMKRTRV